MGDERHAVLYVDDEASNRTTVTYVLGDALDIDTASSAVEALEKLATREYAVLLTDQRMPGMTGIELCERAAKLHPSTVRMILTAYADIGGALRAVEKGQVVRYLRKPFDTEELLQTLRTGIELHVAQRRVGALQDELSSLQPTQVAKIARHEVLHEVGNLTIAIHAGLDGIEDGLDEVGDVPSLRRGLESARRHTDRLQELAISFRRDPLPDARSRPAAVVREVAAAIQLLVPPTVQVETHIEGDPEIAMDEAALHRVVSNLALNAAQAVEARGGSVGLRLTEGRADSTAVLEVRDDGGGVPPELRDRIFDRGFSTRSGGSGLGLPMVRELLGSVGATVSVHPGDPGTVFRVVWNLTNA